MFAHDEALLSICFKTADVLMKKLRIYNREEAGRVRPVARRRLYRQRMQYGEEIKRNSPPESIMRYATSKTINTVKHLHFLAAGVPILTFFM